MLLRSIVLVLHSFPNFGEAVVVRNSSKFALYSIAHASAYFDEVILPRINN